MSPKRSCQTQWLNQMKEAWIFLPWSHSHFVKIKHILCWFSRVFCSPGWEKRMKFRGQTDIDIDIDIWPEEGIFEDKGVRPHDLPILRSLLKTNLNQNISILPSGCFCFVMLCTHFCTVKTGNTENWLISGDLSSNNVEEAWDCYTSCCRSSDSLTVFLVVKTFLPVTSELWLLSLISSVSLHDPIDPLCSQWKWTDTTQA